MKRLWRWLLNAMAGASLLFFMATTALWVRSYRVNDRLYVSHWWMRGLCSNESAYWLLSGRGNVGVGHRVQQAVQRPDAIASFKELVDHPEYSWKVERPATRLNSPQPGGGILPWLGFRYEDDPMPAAFVASGVTGYYREWDAPFCS